MEQIYFLRHGMTEQHIEAREKSVMGFENVGLNEVGRKEIEILGSKIKHLNIQGIICSRQLSSIQTAKIINNYLDVPMYISELLNERFHGEYQHKALEDIYKSNKNFSAFTPGETRESLRAFMNRASKAFQCITSDFNWNECLVISHKGLLKTIFAVCLNTNPHNWYLNELRTVKYDSNINKWYEL